MPSAGLRERKLQRTRALLIDTAVELCLTTGYDNATVEQIAASADVSPRTFSRYFAAKDDVFLAVLEPISDQVLDEIQRLGDQSGPLQTLRAAHVAVFTRIAERPYGTPSADQLIKILRVISASEALRRRAVEHRDPRVMAALAERFGVPVCDYRLNLAKTLFNLSVVTAWAKLVAETEPAHLSPHMMVERMQTVLEDVVTLVADLDPGRPAVESPAV
jgi:AcrR family transcriptional regulator